MDEGERITGPEDWLDMRIGERATVMGKLEGVRYPDENMPFGSGGLTITFADWTTMWIVCNAGAALRPTKGLIPLQSQVCVRVERREDDVLAHAIWMPGSVPIPLNQ